MKNGISQRFVNVNSICTPTPVYVYIGKMGLEHWVYLYLRQNPLLQINNFCISVWPNLMDIFYII